MPALALAVVNEKAPPISSAMPELSALDPVRDRAREGTRPSLPRLPELCPRTHQSVALAVARSTAATRSPVPEHSASGRSVPPDYHHSALDRRPFAAITDGPDAQDFAGSLRRTVDIPTAPVQTSRPGPRSHHPRCMPVGE